MRSPLGHGDGDGVTDLTGRTLNAITTRGHVSHDRCLDPRRCLRQSQMVEHEGDGTDRGGRVGLALPRRTGRCRR